MDPNEVELSEEPSEEPQKSPTSKEHSDETRKQLETFTNKSRWSWCNGENMRFAQLFLLFMLVVMIGGAVFHGIETPEDNARISDAEQRKAEVMALLGNGTAMAELGDEGLFEYLGENSDVFDDGSFTANWDYYNACLFAFTVITTIGYGTFAPTSAGGQVFLVFYALVGIPIAGACLVFLAKRAVYFFTWLFTMGADKVNGAFDLYDDDDSGYLDMDEFRKALDQLGIVVTEESFKALVEKIDDDGSGQIDREEFAEAVKFLNANVTEAAGQKNRIYIVLFALMVWLALGTMAFSLSEGWPAMSAFYFAFVTLTTIGLGDFFPGSTGGRFFLVVFSMLGLGMLATTLSLLEDAFKDMDQVMERARGIKKKMSKVASSRSLTDKSPNMRFKIKN